MAKGNHLTEETQQRMIAAIKAGADEDAIMVRFGVSKSTCRKMRILSEESNVNV